MGGGGKWKDGIGDGIHEGEAMPFEQKREFSLFGVGEPGSLDPTPRDTSPSYPRAGRGGIVQ